MIRVIAIALFGLLTLTNQKVLASSDCSLCEDPTALWCEEFNAADGSYPNDQHWNYDLGGGGWGNFEFQNYTDTNAVIKDGQLHIEVTRGEVIGTYYSSRLLTQDKVSFKHVRLEARIKVSNLQGGLWPAFWLLGANFETVGWPYCGEVDVMELGSKFSIDNSSLHNLVLGAMHWNNYSVTEFDHVYESNGTLLPNDGVVQDFHIYSLDWTPEKVSISVDGVEFFTKPTLDLPAFQEPFFLLLNVAVGGTFTGIMFPNKPTTAGGEMVVDWIRVYDNGSGSSVILNNDQIFDYSQSDCNPANVEETESPTDSPSGDEDSDSPGPDDSPATTFCSTRYSLYWVILGLISTIFA